MPFRSPQRAGGGRWGGAANSEPSGKGYRAAPAVARHYPVPARPSRPPLPPRRARSSPAPPAEEAGSLSAAASSSPRFPQRRLRRSAAAQAPLRSGRGERGEERVLSGIAVAVSPVPFRPRSVSGAAGMNLRPARLKGRGRRDAEGQAGPSAAPCFSSALSPVAESRSRAAAERR